MESRDDIYNVAAVAKNGRYIINQGDDELTGYVDIESLDWYQAAMEIEKRDRGVLFSCAECDPVQL